MARTLIKGGRVIDPASNIDTQADLLFEGGLIKEAGQNLDCAGAKVIDAEGMWVVPGLIDIHVHLRDPGFPHKETIATGSKAAAAGGFTTICAMPNTNPATDSGEVVDYITSTAKEQALVNVLPIGSMTKGLEGRELSRMDEMAKAGMCAVSDDGKWVANPELFKAALGCAKALSLPVLSHCEDLALTGKGQINAGAKADSLGLLGIPPESEETAVERDIALAEEIGAQLHICHISTAGGIEHLRAARQRGQNVTAEVCPHHFTLCDEDIPGRDANFKMSPPLRSRDDLAAIRQALKDGVIDVIATDHAPHHIDDKNCLFEQAQNGIVGLETAVALCITELVDTGLLTPAGLIAKLTANPAKILGLDKGTLSMGADADITIIDPNFEHQIDKGKFQSLGKNTPFDGRAVRGKAMYTIVGGKIVVSKGELVC